MIKRPHRQGGDSAQGIGASLTRKEDERFMHGRGEYVPNIRMVGMVDVAFVRSPIAHGHIVGIEKPEGFEHAIYTLGDMEGVKPIVANSGLPGFKSSEQPVLASGKVRQVGEIIADEAAEQSEQIADFGRRPRPVLGAERKDREVEHADFMGGANDTAQRLDAAAMAFGARQATRGGPASIAVHDDRHVQRNGSIRSFRGWGGGVGHH